MRDLRERIGPRACVWCRRRINRRRHYHIGWSRWPACGRESCMLARRAACKANYYAYAMRVDYNFAELAGRPVPGWVIRS